MFSRQTTLEGVRAFDFDIFYKTILKLNKENLVDDFKFITDTLTIKNGKIVFFPVAIFKNNLCVENGARTDLICSKFNDKKQFESNIEKLEPTDYYGSKIYDFDDGESYLYKRINEDVILVGNSGKYLAKDGLASLYIFIKEDWTRYFIMTSAPEGKYGAIPKTWEKTQGIFYITIITSILLYIFQFLYFRSKEQALQKLKKQSLESDKKLYHLNAEFTHLVQQKLEVENNILKLNRENDDLSKESDIFKEKEAYYIETEYELNQLLDKKKKEIISEEHLDDDIVGQIKKKSEKIDIVNMTKEIEILIDKLHNIRKLWQRELTWAERKTLESKITGFPENIPFTLSQSFILFEKEIVLKMAKSCHGYSDNMGLYEMIKLISDSKDFNNEIEHKLHKIRKARNKWSHAGLLPDNDVIDDLLSILHSFKVEPTF